MLYTLSLKECLGDVKKWLSANKLKVNPDMIKFGSKTVHAKLDKIFPVDILGNLLSRAERSGTFVFGLTQPLPC